MQHVLDHADVLQIMINMGFLPEKELTPKFEDQINDIYILFKINKDQEILAENLQNVLSVIQGI